MTVLTPSVDRRESPSPPDHTIDAADASQAIQLEIQAMQTVAEALATLPDEHSRDRVLAWVYNAFSRSLSVNPHPAQPPRAPISMARHRPPAAHDESSPTSEPGLSLEGVEAFFEDGGPPLRRFEPTPPEPERPRALWPRLLDRIRSWR